MVGGIHLDYLQALRLYAMTCGHHLQHGKRSRAGAAISVAWLRSCA